MMSKMTTRPAEDTNCIRYFNEADDDDVQDLKNWCKIHWTETICKGLKSFNAPTFKFCCICFCRKNYSKKNTHPHHQSASVTQIPGLRNASSADDLYKWVREVILEHQRLGLKPRFPTVNTAHIDQSIDDSDDDEAQLQKVCQDLFELRKSSDEKIKQLSEDNQRLVAACKNWCRKYEELLASKEDDKFSFAEMTPQKMLKTDDSTSSFLLL